MSRETPRAIILHADDDVATVLAPVAAGEVLELVGPGGAAPLAAQSVTARSAIARCHKVAVRGCEAGAQVRKYGAVIGVATAAIAPGDHVHEHNLESRRAQGSKAYG
ncbi:UxaA family hydrolase [Acuticoccus mangrovi]|uniref:UxaA family hydrolase n=1 Tax=Acuticoccus mangrovi TaxID=2796142 RepID=A0A934ILP9_9HYPH|nr:UxaA family hydrolase [Acuticoccus mangrovi]MBJ3774638.1 UxaA family hydrolase [Acuticoccus mangrovi]